MTKKQFDRRIETLAMEVHRSLVASIDRWMSRHNDPDDTLPVLWSLYMAQTEALAYTIAALADTRTLATGVRSRRRHERLQREAQDAIIGATRPMVMAEST